MKNGLVEKGVTNQRVRIGHFRKIRQDYGISNKHADRILNILYLRTIQVHPDPPEVDWLADELIVLWHLFS